MKLKYKGWEISAYPTKETEKNRYWDVLLEDTRSHRTHVFGVSSAFTIKETEELAFETIDKLVEEELKQ